MSFRCSATAATWRPTDRIPSGGTGVVERGQDAAQQVGEQVGVRRPELGQNGPLMGEEIDQGSVHLVCAGLSDLDHDASSVVEGGMSLDKSAGSEPVDPVGHRPRGDQSLLEEPSGRQPVRLTRSTERGEDVELPAFQPMAAERLTTSTVEVSCETGDAAEHLKGCDVEVGAFAAPRRNEVVDLIAARSCDLPLGHRVVLILSQLLTRSSMHWSYSAWLALTELQYLSAF